MALGELRVLDLADEKGLYCTKLMADLGADVLRVERPRGDATRNIGPFLHDQPHPERSLFFAYLNTNKRGITLNLECADGQEVFRRLVKTADILVETFPPGYLARLGLDYPHLREVNPRLILTSITGFGQTGPYRDYKTCDMVGFAMGGLMYLTGDPKSPPVQAGGYQVYYTGSMFAAVATLMAVYRRRTTGEGEHVDVSMQECVASLLETATVNYSYNGVVQKRTGTQHAIAAPCRVYPCQDGYWAVIANAPHMWDALVAWIVEEGIGVEELTKSEYQFMDARRANIDQINAYIAEFGMRHTKAELFAEGQSRRIPVAPAAAATEVLADPHLHARGYFVDLEHPVLGILRYPGAPYKLSETYWRILRPAPLVGQHNQEVYQELGLSQSDLVVLAGVGAL